MTWARTLGKPQDGRRNNGGARKGAGRPISSKKRLLMEQHMMSEIIVKEFRHGQVRNVKKTVLNAVLDSLSKQALQGDIRSAKAYMNLTLGKPMKPNGKKPRYSRKMQINAMAKSGVFPR